MVRYIIPLVFNGCIEWSVRGEEPPTVVPVGVPGNEPDSWIDDYILPYRETADILFIIDDSGSMADEQTALRENFTPMLETMQNSGLDYRVAVTTTDVTLGVSFGQGRLHTVGPHSFAHSLQTNPVGIFQGLADVGTQGSSGERGGDAAWAAIELRTFPGYEANLAWYRPNADQLHFIFISDEDDQSDIGQQEFIQWLWHGFPEEKFVQAHAIVSQPEDDPDCTFGFAIGWRYSDYAKETDGVDYSLCDDWSQTLEDIGLQTAGPNPELVLSHNPVVESIELEADGITYEVCDDGCPAIYRPGRNSVVMLEIPYVGGTEVHVSYQVAGS